MSFIVLPSEFIFPPPSALDDDRLFELLTFGFTSLPRLVVSVPTVVVGVERNVALDNRLACNAVLAPTAAEVAALLDELISTAFMSEPARDGAVTSGERPRVLLSSEAHPAALATEPVAEMTIATGVHCAAAFPPQPTIVADSSKSERRYPEVR